MCRRADALITTSPTIARDLEEFSNAPITILPGPAPQANDRKPTADASRVLWLGSPSTFDEVDGLLEHLATARSDLEFVALGAPSDADPRPGLRLRLWSETRERAELATAGVGLMPMSRSEWNDRKAAYKVLVYLSNGIVPVASDGPALRAALGEWTESLAIVVQSMSVADWDAAIHRASQRARDPEWDRHRADLLLELSHEEYGRRVLKELVRNE